MRGSKRPMGSSWQVKARRWQVIAGVLSVTVLCDARAVTLNGFNLDPASVPVDEIVDAGPGRDGIPAIHQPQFLDAQQAGFLKQGDRILGLSVNGISRAYPISILNYHEVVNDRLGETPVVITFCPLCGSGMAFHARVDGQRLLFGVSGLLYNSDVLLYDLQTESLWSQIRSEAVTGPMRGQRLKMLPLAHTTWRAWQAEHPDTLVMSTDTGFQRDYGRNPYPGYARSRELYFPVAAESRAFRPKALVMGLEIDGHARAYSFDELKKGPDKFSDEFQGHSLQVEYDHRNRTARIMDAEGQEIPTLIAYWFAWYAFHPETDIYRRK